jgi:hypothetical protein
VDKYRGDQQKENLCYNRRWKNCIEKEVKALTYCCKEDIKEVSAEALEKEKKNLRMWISLWIKIEKYPRSVNIAQINQSLPWDFSLVHL